MLSKIKELKEVMGNLVSYNTASERHKATLGVCDIHLRIATQNWEEHMDSPAVKGAGDRLLEKMKGAVAGHMRYGEHNDLTIQRGTSSYGEGSSG